MKRLDLSMALLLAACGGLEHTSAAPTTGVGLSAGASVDSDGIAASDRSVELTLRRADGTFVEVGEQRGRVVLLYVLATFDGASQMMLRPLSDIAERQPELIILGIAAQPSARQLADAYEHALRPPFPITYDPQGTNRAGESDLGAVESIPTLIVLDRNGIEVARHAGFADRQAIEDLLRAAR